MEKTITTKSAAETKEFARKFAQGLRAGQVVALIGDLGAGKTTFVQGIARGSGIKDKIQSPTFVLMKGHEVPPRTQEKSLKTTKKLSLIHVDCYRLRSVKDVLSIGLTDYLGKPDTICVIEWAERIKKILPKGTIYIKFNHIDENSRKIIIEN